MEQKNKKDITPWNWGFTISAENWNGRLAMIGFVSIICIELFTNKLIIDVIKLK